LSREKSKFSVKITPQKEGRYSAILTIDLFCAGNYNISSDVFLNAKISPGGFLYD